MVAVRSVDPLDSSICSPDDILVLFVLAFALLPSSVHDAGVYIGRAGGGDH